VCAEESQVIAVKSRERERTGGYAEESKEEKRKRRGEE
jgi:hypothetical protein